MLNNVSEGGGVGEPHDFNRLCIAFSFLFRLLFCSSSSSSSPSCLFCGCCGCRGDGGDVGDGDDGDGCVCEVEVRVGY